MDIHLLIVFGLSLWLAVMTLSAEPRDGAEEPDRGKRAKCDCRGAGCNAISPDDSPLG